MKLILDSRAREEWPAWGHLVENASNAPHVDGCGVLCRAKKDIWRSVPQSHHLIRIGFGGDRLRSGQAEICQLKHKMRSARVVCGDRVVSDELICGDD